MAVEIEANMAVESFDPVRARLRELGARQAGARLETNTFFDTERGTLRSAGEGLRLRVEREVATGMERHVITWKGPTRAGPLKSREEVELEVAAGDADLLFDRLGYRRTLSFEKRRETWKLEGCTVELDEVPHLGAFVEVEGPDEATVMLARQRLNLSDRPLIRDGYASLLRQHFAPRGGAPAVISFGQ